MSLVLLNLFTRCSLCHLQFVRLYLLRPHCVRTFGSPLPATTTPAPALNNKPFYYHPQAVFVFCILGPLRNQIITEGTNPKQQKLRKYYFLKKAKLLSAISKCHLNATLFFCGTKVSVLQRFICNIYD